MSEDTKSKLYAVAAVVILGISAGAYAGINPFAFISRMSHGALYVWGSDEVVENTDLNANFTELNTTKVGGGVTLTNADVASNAALAHSKLATPALVPKAWATVTANCDGAAAAGTDCTVGDSSQIPSSNGVEATAAAGVYRVNLSYTPANANYAVLVTAHTSGVYCNADTRATAAPHIVIRCWDGAVPGASNNVQFSVLVMDS
jgi:hypothetical protein